MGGIGKYHHFEIASAAKLFTRLCRGDPIVAARKDDQRRVWGKCRIAPWNVGDASREPLLLVVVLIAVEGRENDAPAARDPLYEDFLLIDKGRASEIGQRGISVSP